MSVYKEQNRLEALNADIDMRMWELVVEILNCEDLDHSVVLAYMRAAYGKGYSDAINDEGKLIKDHYLKIPKNPLSESDTSYDAA